MIEKINNIKNFGVFDNYQKSQNFKQYNLIYGWNASGKTTLSRIFRCFELKKIHDDFQQAEFQLKTDKETISNKNLEQYPNIRVFNKDFIDENVFTQENTAKPIYYLGEKNIEKQKKLENLKDEKEKINTKLNSEEKNLKNKKKTKEKFITDKAKHIKEILRTTGTDEYTNYNRSNFCQNIESLNKESISHNSLNEEELDKKKRAINQSIKNKLRSIEQHNHFEEKNIKEINKILKTEVISETINKLKTNKNLNKWVKEGLELYNHSNEGNCHFCEEPMPENRIEALKKHFSQDYENLMSNIAKLIQNWESKTIKISIPDKSYLYDDLSLPFQIEEKKLNTEIKKYNQFIDKILVQLKNKKENPFKNIEEIYYKAFQIKDLIDTLNQVISTHNQKTNNFEKIRLEEKKSIEKHFLSESFEEYQTLKSEISDLKKSVKDIGNEHSKIKKNIESLSQERRDYKITSKTINNKLKFFLGREELIFEATNKENEGYHIKRASNKKFAKSLSEGEKTAIALVYFLSKLNEESFDLKNGIVVIDDPISSLDSNSIFQAFGFIKSEVKKAKQLFILTHNFDFFKHIKHWFKRDYKEQSEFFMIKNFFTEQNKRIANLTSLDELLKNCDSEYQYLFRLLYKSKTDENNTLEEIYPLPNVARKFLETFLSFKFPSEKNYDELFSKVKKKVNFDSSKIEKIKRFINAHSHSNIDKMTSWDISQWSEGKRVIKDILELVEQLDEEHYKELCKISNK